MQVTWYGHSAFRLDFGGKAVLIDPFFTGNPGFGGDPEAAAKEVSHILLTHGHDDHVGDSVAIAKKTGAKVVANFEICMRLNSQGVENIDPMNMGGTLDQGGFTVSMVRADHSSSHNDNGTAVYLGNPGGLIVKAPNEPTIYHMGDTDIFSDMALINEIYAPDVAFVPVGDRFTMSPKLAAMAVKKFFKLKSVVPCHYGSFPIIEPNADKFIAEMKGAATKVIVPEKGKAVTV
ncbi:MAG TPA: metal-dependent hydrolase [Xanthobacteraceae bacterium]|jgi:L-ascorbate metabolism protein UlaG (beta-lactamase superfamily)|nr:metal-dependent hydrolase [Xanthobacteraceae bacterium]